MRYARGVIPISLINARPKTDGELNPLCIAIWAMLIFSRAIRENGYESYAVYINKLRIADFINIIQSSTGVPFHETFFDIGYRSRTTALRNFRIVTGTTPSEYFQMLNNSKLE